LATGESADADYAELAMSEQSVYDAAGGDAAFQRLAAANHERCLAEPELNHAFSHDNLNPAHVERLGWYWAEVFGGPPRFTDSCGGQVPMLELHACNGAPDDWKQRFLTCFLAAIDDAQLPDDPHLRQVLGDYMAWAVHDVMAYEEPGAVVPRGLGVPRWSWNGLVSNGR
jgi:hemoglobin